MICNLFINMWSNTDHGVTLIKKSGALCKFHFSHSNFHLQGISGYQEIQCIKENIKEWMITLMAHQTYLA